MKRYVKKINGEFVSKTRSEIVIEHDGMCTYNPSETMILANGWIEYIPSSQEPTEEEMLQYAKETIINDILSYDSSSEVNIFYVEDMPIWLDKATRAGLMLRLQAETMTGLTETSLWYNNIEFKLSVEVAIQMLYALEVYASKCYDNTQYHISNISKLTNLDDIYSYNYKVGYPNPLKFE